MTTSPMSLLDNLLPHYQFQECHRIAIRAPAAAIMRSIRAYRALHDPLIRLAIGLREGPARLLGRRPGPMLDLDDFTILGREGEREIVFGLMGAFWKADYGLVPLSSAACFHENHHPGLCRLAMGFAIAPLSGDIRRVTTRTRVFCPTPASQRRFAPYWYAIRPVSGLIRRRMLGRIRAMAQRPSFS
ncbi:hypothetical protein [Novacetimonas pomaceti]|uniref:DUF2867 domain-containing protein n=1 Tax=Novacetimonas pomaceti TaxID=2021998 RepID=A0ABX5P3P7_9PROT|nr:hypothetical protein [Novacetimonas pomaceti]PYD48392.1 hypothetical protein C3920_04925 [Novacetimonas pomaceti]